MTTEQNMTIHRQLAMEFFNHNWDLMEKENRTTEEIDEMIHAAHASCSHWGIAGEALQHKRGEWQISRAYAVAKHPEECLYHARRCLEITLKYGIGDFDRTFAFEAMSRAYNLLDVEIEMLHYQTLALEAAEKIEINEDRTYFLRELQTI